MRFVEEENELRFFRIAYFGKILEQFREHPGQEGRVNLRRFLHQLVGSENVDHAFNPLRLDQMVEIECRLTGKPVRTLSFERENRPLEAATAGTGETSLFRVDWCCV